MSQARNNTRTTRLWLTAPPSGPHSRTLSWLQCWITSLLLAQPCFYQRLTTWLYKLWSTEKKASFNLGVICKSGGKGRKTVDSKAFKSC